MTTQLRNPRSGSRRALRSSALLAASLLAVAQPAGAQRKDADVVAPYQLIPIIDPIDVSGTNATHAQHGVSYNGTASTGADGRDGGDAGYAGTSTAAGGITLDASVARDGQGRAIPGTLVLEGEVRPSGGRGGAYRKVVEFGRKGYIFLKAIGGNGGNGGFGGNGEGGGPGRDGRAASSSGPDRGEDGGNGGDGGDAGRGTPGTDGSPGGPIRVKVKESETHLLMLFKAWFNGGQGGAAGRNGTAGAAGRAGRGGSGNYWTEYWTEQESYTDTEYDTTTNDDGSTSTTSRTVTKYRTVTKSRQHWNPGGSDGRAGSSGRGASGNTAAGRDAADGSYVMQVVRANGKVDEYTSIYDLKLMGFEFWTFDEDGVWEPGEKVHVGKIKVRNTGGMPLPAGAKSMVFLSTTQWVLADPIEIEIPVALEPGQEIELEQRLTFTIADTEISKPGGPFVTEDKINPLAYLREANRPYEEFEHGQKFQIRFPVEIEEVRALRTLGAGETTKFFMKLTNTSSKAIGDETELKRLLSVSLKHKGGELSPDQIVFQDKDGKDTSLTAAFIEAVRNLGPGQSVDFMGTLGLPDGVPSLADAQFHFELNLGKHTDLATPRVAQIRELTLRSVEGYSVPKKPSVLLVVGNRNTREEIDAWRRHYARIGLETEIWDLSYYGYLDLANRIFTDTRLKDDFRGKTITILDQEYNSPSGPAQALEMLGIEQFRDAATQAGIGFYVPGPSGLRLIEDALLPVGGRLRRQFRSMKQYLRTEKVAETMPWDDPAAEFDHVEIRAYHLGEPSEAYLKRKAEELQAQLDRIHPDRRYFVVQEFEPKKLRELGIGRWSSFGRLVVKQAPDVNVGTAVGMTVDDATLHSLEFIESDANLYGSFSAMQFPELLRHLRRMIFQAARASQDPSLKMPDYEKPLLAAILGELEREQAILRQTNWAEGMSAETIRAKLPKLRALSEIDLPDGDFFDYVDAPDDVAARQAAADDKLGVPDEHRRAAPRAAQRRVVDSRTEEAQAIVEFTAKFQAYLTSQVGFWDHVMPGRRQGMVTKESRRMLDRFFDEVFPKGTGEHQIDVHVAARNALKAKTQLIRDQWEIDRQGKRGIRVREQGQREIAPTDSRLATDVGSLRDASARVLTQAQYQGLEAQAKAREERRLKQIEENKAAINALRGTCAIPFGTQQAAAQ